MPTIPKPERRTLWHEQKQRRNRPTKLAGRASKKSPATEDPRRKQAVARIERRRHFHGELGVTGIGVVVLIAIWATSETQRRWLADAGIQSELRHP